MLRKFLRVKRILSFAMSFVMIIAMVLILDVYNVNAGDEKIWMFTNTTESWTAASGISGFGWQTGGYIGGTLTSSDPQLKSPDNLKISITNNKFLLVKMKNGTASTRGKLYFITTTSTNWNEAKSKTFTLIPNDTYTEYVIDMTNVAGWTGVLKQLRLDPIDDGGNTSVGSFSIDYIKIVQTKPVETFVLGQTMPTLSNTGPRYPLKPFTTPNPGDTLKDGILTINTNGSTYQNIDFGSIWIDVKAKNVTIRDCKFTNTRACTEKINGARGIIQAVTTLSSNLLVEFCSFDNAPPSGVVTASLNGINGYNFTLRRSNIQNLTDGVSTFVHSSQYGGPINTVIEGNYITNLSWWYDSTKGVVHPSDNKTHNDVIQHQGGTGLVVIGNYLRAVYSTTVGTFGAIRDEIVDGNGAYPNHNGGSLAAIMVNTARGTEFNGKIQSNWIGGGAYSINAGTDSLTGHFGIIWNNRFYRDQRHAGYAIAIDNDVTADVGAGTSNRNIWIDDGSEVRRKNG